MTWLAALFSLGTIIATPASQTPPKNIVTGVVADPANLPLPGVVITIRGSVSVAVTDEQGRFSIQPPSLPAILLAELPGFSTREINVSDAAKPIVITMAIAPVSAGVTVHADVLDAVPDARLAMRPLDVVRTAGTQADIMRAVAGLPGVTVVDEGAGIFVRGGDVSETRVLLNGAVINHPYRYETPTGGFRGAVDPFLTQGLTFSTGGFSAEYSNSLSGILDMQGLARPGATRTTLTAGLAGLSAQVAAPLGKNNGVRFAANRTTTGVLFAVNPAPREFDELPSGWDASGSFHADRAAGGVARVFWTTQRDHVGVRLDQDGFSGFLHSSTEHHVLVADWRRSLPKQWDAAVVLGFDRYTGGTNVGVFALDMTDVERSLRMDAGGPLGGWRIRTGADLGLTSSLVTGFTPERGGDFAGVSGQRLFDVHHDETRGGAYVESTRAFGRVTPTVGIRTDRFGFADTWTVDPRVNVTIDTGGRSRLRLAWGRYHQAPSPLYFDDASGSVQLGPMAATHYIVGIETGRMTDAFFLRAEAYYKTYTNLPVDNSAGGYAQDGYGYARGVDVFVRRVWHFVDVRGTASILDAQRRWTSPDQRERFPLPSGTWTPDFAIPFSWQLNVTAPVWKTVSVAASWRVAAGRPFTPVLGATTVASGYEPIWGPINSERVPHYGRVDLSVSHMRSLGKHGTAVFFASVDNLSGRANFFEYSYSADYTVRQPVAGASPRSFYVGCSISR